MEISRNEYEYITKEKESILEIQIDETEIKPITKRPRRDYENITRRKGRAHKGYTKMVRTNYKETKINDEQSETVAEE